MSNSDTCKFIVCEFANQKQKGSRGKMRDIQLCFMSRYRCLIFCYQMNKNACFSIDGIQFVERSLDAAVEILHQNSLLSVMFSI